jgi:hypothetical protein
MSGECGEWGKATDKARNRHLTRLTRAIHFVSGMTLPSPRPLAALQELSGEFKQLRPWMACNVDTLHRVDFRGVSKAEEVASLLRQLPLLHTVTVLVGNWWTDGSLLAGVTTIQRLRLVSLWFSQLDAAHLPSSLTALDIHDNHQLADLSGLSLSLQRISIRNCPKFRMYPHEESERKAVPRRQVYLVCFVCRGPGPHSLGVMCPHPPEYKVVPGLKGPAAIWDCIIDGKLSRLDIDADSIQDIEHAFIEDVARLIPRPFLLCIHGLDWLPDHFSSIVAQQTIRGTTMRLSLLPATTK